MRIFSRTCMHAEALPIEFEPNPLAAKLPQAKTIQEAWVS